MPLGAKVDLREPPAGNRTPTVIGLDVARLAVGQSPVKRPGVSNV